MSTKVDTSKAQSICTWKIRFSMSWCKRRLIRRRAMEWRATFWSSIASFLPSADPNCKHNNNLTLDIETDNLFSSDRISSASTIVTSTSTLSFSTLRFTCCTVATKISTTVALTCVSHKPIVRCSSLPSTMHTKLSEQSAQAGRETQEPQLNACRAQDRAWCCKGGTSFHLFYNSTEARKIWREKVYVIYFYMKELREK